MILLKSCPRCHGDMMREEMLGDVEMVCLQCGFRSEAIAQTKPAIELDPVRIRDAA